VREVVWRANARDNLIEIIRFISSENIAAAKRLHPCLYRIGRVDGTREIVVLPNYIVVYRFTTSQIEVLSVLHARQQYPR
jgi:plasmid stabilization system protein ParE